MTSFPGLGLAVLRVTLGVIFVMHGYLGLAVIGPASIAGYTTRMGYPTALGPALAWYLILAHSVGGILLVLGLFTRWAAAAQLPIMASAFFLHHLKQGFFLTGIVVDPAKRCRHRRRLRVHGARPRRHADPRPRGRRPVRGQALILILPFSDTPPAGNPW